MPSRVIRGEINSSESLSRVSLEADLTFRALIVAVDDFGRMDARPKILKAALYPMRDVSVGQIMDWLEELCREGCVQRYQVAGRWYLQLTNWEIHRGRQRRAKESRLPPPAGTESQEILLGVGGGVGGGVGAGLTIAHPSQTSPEIPGDPRMEGFDPTKLVGLLGAGDHPRKLLWLEEHLPNIIAAARYKLAKDGKDDPSQRALRAAVIDRLHAFWKTHQKPDMRGMSPTQAREERSREAARRVIEEPSV